MSQFDQLETFKTFMFDSDELICNPLIIIFAVKGCFIKTAETSNQGLRALEREKYDISISDLKFPWVAGLKFSKFASMIQPGPGKLQITSYRDDHVYSKALWIVVSEFIEKPFSADV